MVVVAYVFSIFVMCSSPKYFNRFDSVDGFTKYYRCRCGKCPSCLKQDRQEWCFRMLQEFENNRCGVFVTLTYNNENLPLSVINLDGEDVVIHPLRYSDVQKFLKRLRRNYNLVCPEDKRNNLRYWCCGEYGKKKGRPHYHLIIYGLQKEYYYLVNECWQLGFTYCGYAFNERTVNYVSKYVIKQGLLNNTAAVGSREWCQSNGLVCPCRHMSLGLGKNYLTRERLLYHLNFTSIPQDRSISTFVNGEIKYSNPILCSRAFIDGTNNCYVLPLPRYYRKKIFEESKIVDYPIKFRRDYKRFAYRDSLSKNFHVPYDVDISSITLSDLQKSEDFNYEVENLKDNNIILPFVRFYDDIDYSDLDQDEIFNLSVEGLKKNKVPIINF